MVFETRNVDRGNTVKSAYNLRKPGEHQERLEKEV